MTCRERNRPFGIPAASAAQNSTMAAKDLKPFQFKPGQDLTDDELVQLRQWTDAVVLSPSALFLQE